jgi:hypothetical protein
MENKMFYVRDQALGEDYCRGSASNWLQRCSPREERGVVNVLQMLGFKNGAAQLRTFAANPVKALQALHRKITEN